MGSEGRTIKLRDPLVRVGGGMTVLLLASLAVTVTGAPALHAREEGAGPLAPLLAAGIEMPAPALPVASVTDAGLNCLKAPAPALD